MTCIVGLGIQRSSFYGVTVLLQPRPEHLLEFQQLIDRPGADLLQGGGIRHNGARAVNRYAGSSLVIQPLPLQRSPEFPLYRVLLVKELVENLLVRLPLPLVYVYLHSDSAA